MPQVEVSFDIDANGIVHVTAKDKKTGKEQKVEIKAGSGLSDDEIQRMVSDAETHREEERTFQELVPARPQRSDERRVGKGWVTKVSYRWSPSHTKNKKK